MTCRCPYCNGSQVPSAPSSPLAENWPPPVVLPSMIKEGTSADIYDQIFEVAINHYALFISDPNRLVGATVLFADAYAAIVVNKVTSGSKIHSKISEKNGPVIEIVTTVPTHKNDKKTDKKDDIFSGPLKAWKDEDELPLSEWSMIVDESGCPPQGPQLPAPQGMPFTFQAPQEAGQPPPVDRQHQGPFPTTSQKRSSTAPVPQTLTGTTSWTRRPQLPSAESDRTLAEVDALQGRSENRWMYLVSVMRWRRRWSLKATAKRYANHGMPKNLDGPAQGFGWHIGRWQWREIRQYW